MACKRGTVMSSRTDTSQRIVLKLTDEISLSIIQGRGCMGNEKDGTVEVGILRDGFLAANPFEYYDGQCLADLINTVIS